MAKLEKIDWLSLEANIREQLALYRDGHKQAIETVLAIDNLLADTTHRGNELSNTPNGRE